MKCNNDLSCRLEMEGLNYLMKAIFVPGERPARLKNQITLLTSLCHMSNASSSSLKTLIHNLSAGNPNLEIVMVQEYQTSSLHHIDLEDSWSDQHIRFHTYSTVESSHAHLIASFLK